MRFASLMFGGLGWMMVAASGCSDDAGSSTGSETTASSADTGATSCTPGETMTCTCNGVPGTQECTASGTAFGPCLCDGGTTNTTNTSTDPTDPTNPTDASAADSSGGDSSGGDATGSTDDGGTTGGTTDGGTTDGGTTGGTTDGGSTDGGSSTGGGGGPLMIGDPCNADAECNTSVCWDFSDYDPFCFGTACSLACVSDMQCVAAMTAAGAPNPANTSCQPDGRCDMMGTGFGAFACAGPSPVRASP